MEKEGLQEKEKENHIILHPCRVPNY